MVVMLKIMLMVYGCNVEDNDGGCNVEDNDGGCNVEDVDDGSNVGDDEDGTHLWCTLLPSPGVRTARRVT